MSVPVDDFGQPIRECFNCDRVGCAGCTPDDAEYLRTHLGHRLTMLLNGPAQYAQARDAFTRIAATESPDTARAWLIAMNPQLDDDNPLLVIANSGDIRHAVRDYLTDGTTT